MSNIELNEGMYVCFPVENDLNGELLFGQIEQLDDETGTLKVRVFDLSVNEKYGNIYNSSYKLGRDKVKRCVARFDAKAKYKGKIARILSTETKKDRDNYYLYLIEIPFGNSVLSKYVSEKELCFHMCDAVVPVLSDAKQGNFCDSQAYKARHIISATQSQIRMAPEGFNSVLGSKSTLYSHQLDAVVRAFEELPCRLMLADEVGLGKTIEACAILKGMQKKNRKLRALIIVPRQLIQQWYYELKTKFAIEAVTCPTFVPLINSGVYLISFDNVRKASASNLNAFLDCPLDFCILDEAHKVINMPRLYGNLQPIIRHANNRLLLSATPVSQENTEFQRLVSLLEPEKYENMDADAFIALAQTQNKIRNVINGIMRDLPDAKKIDRTDRFIKQLSGINEIIKDTNVKNELAQIKKKNNLSDRVDQIQEILSYISEHYRVDNNFIRHRKAEIEEANIQRELVELVYEPSGASEGFFEQDAFNCLDEKLREVFNRGKDEKIVNMCKLLMQLTMSSPYAVLGNVKHRDHLEGDLLERYFEYIEKWKIAFDWEIQNIQLLSTKPYKFHSKLAEIIKWIEKIDQNKQQKYLIFSEFPQTTEQYSKAFQRYFGEESTRTFKSEMTPIEMKAAVDDFQNNQKCRFVICDRTGGIGRNFQMADYIVHCELPWSPAILEQRIGRLDRIGRKIEKPVISAVIHADYGPEKDLFDLYNEGLNAFNRSLCGMEISFDAIEQRINDAFVTDPKHGIRDIIPEIKEIALKTDNEIEQEMYYDMARQLDQVETQQIDELVSSFDTGSNKFLENAIIEWAGHIGFKDISQSQNIEDTMIFNVLTADKSRMKQMRYTIPFKKDLANIKGTFSRQTAIAHENTYFIAPNTQFYDSFAQNAEQSRLGTVSAIEIKGKGLPWEGFVLSWNFYPDYNKLFENSIPSEYLRQLGRFSPNGQITTYISCLDLSECDDPQYIRPIVECLSDCNNKQMESLHSIDKIQETSSYIGERPWDSLLDEVEDVSRKAATKKWKEFLELENAREFLEKRYTIMKVQEKQFDTYASMAQLSKAKYLNMFLHGLENPIMRLDSIAYVRMN